MGETIIKYNWIGVIVILLAIGLFAYDYYGIGHPEAVVINCENMSKEELIVWLDKRAIVLDQYKRECIRISNILKRSDP